MENLACFKQMKELLFGEDVVGHSTSNVDLTGATRLHRGASLLSTGLGEITP